jgi:Rieske Fe-S protein
MDASRLDDLNMDGKPDSDRRRFVRALGAAVLAGAAITPPLAAGIATFLHPVKRRAGEGTWVRVASLPAVPNDNVPRRFLVVADQVNAWNRVPNVAVGAVFLRRTAPDTVHALNVVCPHAGCLVDYVAGDKNFLCPCHNSTFAIDGAINDPRSPSPRPMDSLEVEIRDSDQVWVRFRNFRTGLAVKVAVS